MAKPLIINADRAPDPANAHTWFPLTGSAPGEPSPRILSGTLRGQYRGFEPTAVAFGQAKVQPVPAGDGDPWAVTAVRGEVLLPPGADDRFACPRILMEEADALATAASDPRLAYVTFTWMPERLHEQWEEIRAFCVEGIVGPAVGDGTGGGFGCPVLLVQHAPHLQRRSTLPHVHLMIVPHKLNHLGWSIPASKLVGDKGRTTIVERFAAFRARRAAAGAASIPANAAAID